MTVSICASVSGLVWIRMLRRRRAERLGDLDLDPGVVQGRARLGDGVTVGREVELGPALEVDAELEAADDAC